MKEHNREDPGLRAEIEVVHYADPWCWWSWGLEPVIQRLKEVYGHQIQVTYKFAPVFDDIEEWMKEYGIEGDTALEDWIKDSVSMTGVPCDPSYLVKTRVKSTWPACLACKAAQLQDGERAERFYRRLIEAIQVEAKDDSDIEVILRIAQEVGLDPSRLKEDSASSAVKESVRKDLKEMKESESNYLTLVLVHRKTGGKLPISEVFSATKFEEAIDALPSQGVQKKTPIDILDYLERHDSLVSSKEIAEVFQTSEEDAVRRLSKLTKDGLLEVREFDLVSGSFWILNKKAISRLESLTPIQLELSHVTTKAKASTEAYLYETVTKAVQGLYTEIAAQPNKTYHFPLGQEATLFVGYPESELNQLPPTAIESFAGVGYPFAAQAIKPGDTVLDVGSGSGTDVLVALLKTRPYGKVVGLDFTEAMMEKARANIEKMGAKNARIVKGNAMEIPFEDASFDVVTSNGVLNLVPDKKKAFSEIYRVLKPGGRIQIADIVVQKDVQKACGLVPQLWADCIGGAAVESEYLKTIENSGFRDLRIIKRLDYFSKSASDTTKRLTKTFEAESLVITAVKPT